MSGQQDLHPLFCMQFYTTYIIRVIMKKFFLLCALLSCHLWSAENPVVVNNNNVPKSISKQLQKEYKHFAHALLKGYMANEGFDAAVKNNEFKTTLSKDSFELFKQMNNMNLTKQAIVINKLTKELEGPNKKEDSGTIGGRVLRQYIDHIFQSSPEYNEAGFVNLKLIFKPNFKAVVEQCCLDTTILDRMCRVYRHSGTSEKK